MNSIKSTTIRYIDDRDEDLILLNKVDCNTSEFESSKFIIVVANVFDSTNNFVKQKIFKYSDYDLSFEDDVNEVGQVLKTADKKFLKFIKDDILEIGVNSDLSLGVYSINFEFYDDIFDSYGGVNKFIITELSSDRSEVRLSPASGNPSFIQTFDLFKKYSPITRTFISSNIADFDRYVREYAANIVNVTYADLIFKYDSTYLSQINQEDFTIKLDGSMSDYILSVFRTQVDNVNDISIEEINKIAVRKTKEYLLFLKGEFLSSRGVIGDLLYQSYVNDIRVNLSDKLSEDLSDEELDVLVNSFKQDIYDKAIEILREQFSQILNN